jgi:outer membrane receptor protein involved in Fe transport
LLEDETEATSLLAEIANNSDVRTHYNANNGSSTDLSGTYAAEDTNAELIDFAEWVEDNVGLETSKINVSKGDQLANLPQHRLKFRLNYDHNSDFRIGLTALGYGKAYLMGNENQKHDGDGETSGYVIFNADAHWSPAKNWLVSLKAINLLDKDYYSGGRLLMNGFTGIGTNTRSGADAFRGPGFVPGSPQAAWITLSYQFK